VRLAPEQLDSYSHQIIQFNEKCKRSMTESHGARKVPVVCSEQTHWKARKMIPLLAYLHMKNNVRRPDIEKLVTA
jgi:hypothetical protein